MGDEHRSVAARQGNEFMYVTLLLSVLGSLNGNRWVIEQPCSSCLFQIPIASHVMQLLQAMKAKNLWWSLRQNHAEAASTVEQQSARPWLEP